jgi:hypothetical protein
MQQQANKVAKFLRLDKRTHTYIGADCPMEMGLHYLDSSRNRTLPTLHAIAEAPTVRGDGSVVQTPGFDDAAKLFLAFKDGAFPRVPDHPNREEADNALMWLRHVVRGIAFKGSADTLKTVEHEGEIYVNPTRDVRNPETCTTGEAVWLSALMTAIIRASLPTAPFYLFSSPVKGSAKTLAADLIGIAATGHRQACAPWAKSEEERRKALFAHLRHGDPVMLIDNLDNGEVIDCPRFAAILTQNSYKDRILGHSEEETVPTTTTFLMTGNNIIVASDLTRRALRCYIDPETEHPARRKYDWDARREVEEKRPVLVAAVLTIIRAYLSAAEKDDFVSPATSAVGSFELWDRYVRQPIVWLGCKDPMISQSEIIAEDPTDEDVAAVFEAVYAAYGEHKPTVKEMLADIKTRCFVERGSPVQKAITGRLGALREAFEDLEGYDHASAKSLGKWFSRHQGRIVNGLRLCLVGTSDRARKWYLRDTTGSRHPTLWTPDRFDEAATAEVEDNPIPF